MALPHNIVGIYTPANSLKVQPLVDQPSPRRMDHCSSKRCLELCHLTNLSGGTLRADYEPVHRYRLRHPAVLKVKGYKHKIPKKKKSHDSAITSVQMRRERLKKETSLLSSSSYLMSPPKRRFRTTITEKLRRRRLKRSSNSRRETMRMNQRSPTCAHKRMERRYNTVMNGLQPQCQKWEKAAMKKEKRVKA